MSMGHVTRALLMVRGCPEDRLDAAMDALGYRVPPDSVAEVLADVDAAITEATRAT